jgi:UDP-N-acetylglucosamine transferase subunit ALG13
MIFVTVGTQLAFDRLIEAVDEWAASVPEREMFAQIGPGEYLPHRIAYRDYIPPEEHARRMSDADLIIGHAGMGTIIRALELGKPVLVMPRQAARGEHRNDHQLATARRFSETGRVTVFNDVNELQAALGEALAAADGGRIDRYASSRLIGALSAFINS